jgi:hypothetical protein
LYVGRERPPALQANSEFKYSLEYSKAAKRAAARKGVIISVVTEDPRVLGFGISVQQKCRSKIEIVNVGDFSGRRAGLERIVAIGSMTFTVEVGHALVDLLLPALRRPFMRTRQMRVCATSSNH